MRGNQPHDLAQRGKCLDCIAGSHVEPFKVSGCVQFKEAFSATQVARGRPVPDLFLFAAASMHADPATCVVIEDSVPGVQTAVAAGERAIGFTGGGHAGLATRSVCSPPALPRSPMICAGFPALVSPA